MDAKQILELLNEKLSDLGADIEIFFEESGALRMEVVSSQFRGVRLMSRIAMVSDKIIELCHNELADYTVIINPLTKLEKEQEISETSSTSQRTNSGNDGMVASQSPL